MPITSISGLIIAFSFFFQMALVALRVIQQIVSFIVFLSDWTPVFCVIWRNFPTFSVFMVSSALCLVFFLLSPPLTSPSSVVGVVGLFDHPSPLTPSLPDSSLNPGQNTTHSVLTVPQSQITLVQAHIKLSSSFRSKYCPFAVAM